MFYRNNLRPYQYNFYFGFHIKFHRKYLCIFFAIAYMKYKYKDQIKKQSSN